MQCELLNKKREPICDFIFRKTIQQWKGRAWHKVRYFCFMCVQLFFFPACVTVIMLTIQSELLCEGETALLSVLTCESTGPFLLNKLCNSSHYIYLESDDNLK
jgi:hypothetical protein